MTRRRLWPAMAMMCLLVGVAEGCAVRQTAPVSSSGAEAFLGTWVFAMTNPPGAEETVRIRDENGVVTATVQAGRFPPQEVSGILKDGDMLVLTATRLKNGAPVRAAISLISDGDAMIMAQMLEGSDRIMRGSGRRQ